MATLPWPRQPARHSSGSPTGGTGMPQPPSRECLTSPARSASTPPARCSKRSPGDGRWLPPRRRPASGGRRWPSSVRRGATLRQQRPCSRKGISTGPQACSFTGHRSLKDQPWSEPDRSGLPPQGIGWRLRPPTLPRLAVHACVASWNSWKPTPAVLWIFSKRSRSAVSLEPDQTCPGLTTTTSRSMPKSGWRPPTSRWSGRTPPTTASMAGCSTSISRVWAPLQAWRRSRKPPSFWPACCGSIARLLQRGAGRTPRPACLPTARRSTRSWAGGTRSAGLVARSSAGRWSSPPATRSHRRAWWRRSSTSSAGSGMQRPSGSSTRQCRPRRPAGCSRPGCTRPGENRRGSSRCRGQRSAACWQQRPRATRQKCGSGCRRCSSDFRASPYSTFLSPAAVGPTGSSVPAVVSGSSND